MMTTFDNCTLYDLVVVDLSGAPPPLPHVHTCNNLSKNSGLVTQMAEYLVKTKHSIPISVKCVLGENPQFWCPKSYLT
jgi:hypothetical protein